jgi:PAS domain S-box-containing protein
MVVEDEREAATDLKEALETMGYAVTDVVASALESIHAAEQRRPDIALMDINLPGELDGIDAARVLRDRFDIPVVFVSGYADDRTMTRAKLTGAFGYLVKPFRWNEVKSAVEVALFRHQLERQLRDRERWLTTTLRAFGDAAVVVDPAGRVTFMNAAAEALLQQPEAAVRGKPLTGLFHLINESTREPLSDPHVQVMSSAEVTRLPRNAAMVIAGRELPVDYSLAPITDENGNVSGAVAIIKDLTEQRRAQQRVAFSDRLASLGFVAAGIAHEINNPLTYVLGNLEFLGTELDRLGRLLEGRPAPDGAEAVGGSLQALGEVVQDAMEGARHVTRIVRDLSFFAQRDASPQLFDVVERMEWALRVSHSAISRHARVKREFRPVPKARGDEARLGQVFLNLLLNAAYAMRTNDPSANELTVSIEPEPGGENEPNQFIRIAVRDTGCGMTPDVLKRIFDPFFTTKPPGVGTGIGLAVSHAIVAEMGGDISVVSKPGEGSTFVVRLPAPARDALQDPVASHLAGLRARVLVIDDEPRVLAVLSRMLGSIHEVVTTHRAQAALELLKDGAAFDVILCDLLMPELNGMEFYREVARLSPDLPSRIVFLSGGANAELASEFFATIPNVALQKPAAAADLLAAIERQLTHAASDARQHR